MNEPTIEERAQWSPTTRHYVEELESCGVDDLKPGDKTSIITPRGTFDFEVQANGDVWITGPVMREHSLTTYPTQVGTSRRLMIFRPTE